MSVVILASVVAGAFTFLVFNVHTEPLSCLRLFVCLCREKVLKQSKNDCIIRRNSTYVRGGMSLVRDRHNQMLKRSPNTNDNYAVEHEITLASGE